MFGGEKRAHLWLAGDAQKLQVVCREQQEKRAVDFVLGERLDVVLEIISGLQGDFMLNSLRTKDDE